MIQFVLFYYKSGVRLLYFFFNLPSTSAPA